MIKTCLAVIGALAVFGAIVAVIVITLAARSGGDGDTRMEESEFTIRIVGTEGLPFAGTYQLNSASGRSASHRVEGTVPTEYTVRASFLSVVFEKTVEAGELRVEILRDGSVIRQSSTTLAYGDVDLVIR